MSKPQSLGYPKRVKTRHSQVQPKPFRFKEVDLGPAIGPPISSAGLPPVLAEEARVINGKDVQSQEEWNLYKALLYLQIPKQAILYQVPYRGGRSLGGQVLDFLLLLGGAPVVIRIMGSYWHPGEYGTATDVYGFGQLLADGYIVKDISASQLQTVEGAAAALKGLNIF